MSNLSWTPHSTPELDNYLNHTCVSPRMGCTEYITKNQEPISAINLIMFLEMVMSTNICPYSTCNMIVIQVASCAIAIRLTFIVRLWFAFVFILVMRSLWIGVGTVRARINTFLQSAI